MRRLQIVADENIARLDDYLAAVADIRYLPGRTMQARDLQHADALLVRSVTKVDAQLLAGSAVKFVGSCTIGTDHVDLEYLQQQSISFRNAPGCNADPVVDYVLSAMLAVEPDLATWRKRRALVVGYGEVGSRLYRRLTALGINTKIFDPFKVESNATQEDFFAADIISLHVPLTRTGEHATWHLFDAERLQQLKPQCLLINSSRGPVIDNIALQTLLQAGKLRAVLDVYEDEPEPSPSLLALLDIATSHIAGYSEQGKIRGTEQVVAGFSEHFALAMPDVDILGPTVKYVDAQAVNNVADLAAKAYDIRADSAAFIAYYLQDNALSAGQRFDQFRKQYPVRTEWQYQKITVADSLVKTAAQLGLSVQNK